MMDMMSGSAVAGMLAWMFLVFGILAVGIVWLVRGGLRSVRDSARSASVADQAETLPVEILRRRYAAGEIDEEEYLTRLSGLSQR